MHRRQLVLGLAAGGLAAGGAAYGLLLRGALSQGVSRARAGDNIVTGPGEELVFVAGRDAMLLRPNSTLALAENGFRLVTGAVLCVFAPRQRKELQTATATIGIRGTAVYLEAERARTYVCTCYGETLLQPVDEPAAREAVRPARRHGEPRYIVPRGAPRMVSPAPLINHTDAELELLQKLLPK